VPTDGAEPENGGGLSTGAKAGIGAGVAVAAVVIIAGVVFWLLTKRKSKANPGETIKLNGGAESGSDTNRHSYTDQSSHGAGVVGGYYDPKEQHKISPHQHHDEITKGDASNPGELPGDLGRGRGQVFEMSGEARAVEAPNNSVQRSTK
jgi:preprotein translocase subunit Sec61beta